MLSIFTNDIRIWLLDLARNSSKDTKCDGFDISLDQCPPPSWLPANVNTHQWDIFDDPSPEFINAFDVVHVRLITFVVKHSNPAPIVKNLCKLLSETLAQKSS